MEHAIPPDMLVDFLEVLLQNATSGEYPALFQARGDLHVIYGNLKASIEAGTDTEQQRAEVTELLSTSGIAKEVFAVAIEYSLKVARSQIDQLNNVYPEDEPPPESAKQFVRESLAPFILRIARKANLSAELIHRFEQLSQ